MTSQDIANGFALIMLFIFGVVVLYGIVCRGTEELPTPLDYGEEEE